MSLSIFKFLTLVGMLSFASAFNCFGSSGITKAEDPADSTAVGLPGVLSVRVDTLERISSVVEVSAYIEYPTDTTTQLSRAIGEFFCEMFGGTWKGSCTDYYALTEDYVETLARDYKEEALGWGDDPVLPWYEHTEVLKFSENDFFVSYLFSRETYTGGAHGNSNLYAMTFRKSDGHRMGWDVFKETQHSEFASLIRKGLMDFWDISDEDESELRYYLFDQSDYDYPPLPQSPPLFTEEGVLFIYNRYEIAGYALGTPVFMVPYSKLHNFMMETARRLFPTPSS